MKRPSICEVHQALDELDNWMTWAITHKQISKTEVDRQRKILMAARAEAAEVADHLANPPQRKVRLVK